MAVFRKGNSDSDALKAFWAAVRTLESDGEITLHKKDCPSGDNHEWADISDIWLQFWATWKQVARLSEDGQTQP